MSVCRIQLGGHKGPIRGWALVDEPDYEDLMQFRWSLIDGYASRSVECDGRWRVDSMHRRILGLSPGDGWFADHINRDRLDNRRSNLRVVTPAANTQNVASRSGSVSPYRGVRRSRHHWQAFAHLDGKFKHLGVFDEELAAAKAAEAFRLQHMPAAVPLL